MGCEFSAPAGNAGMTDGMPAPTHSGQGTFLLLVTYSFETVIYRTYNQKMIVPD
jgi:hypothetical protein